LVTRIGDTGLFFRNQIKNDRLKLEKSIKNMEEKHLLVFNFHRFSLDKLACLKLIIEGKINLKKSIKVHIFLCSSYFINLRTSHCFIRRPFGKKINY